MRDRLYELIVNIENEIYRENPYMSDSERIKITVDRLLAAGVIVPPCKVGDTGYYIGGIHGKLIKEAKVEEIYYGDGGFAFRMCSGYSYFDLQENEVFFTIEEAEKALEARRGV